MKSTDQPQKLTITMTARRFLGTTLVVALVAQLVVVYSIAGTAQLQGATTSPARAVSTFLLTLLLFGVVVVAGVILLWAAVWVLHIPVAKEASPQQRRVFSAIRIVLALGIVIGVPFLTHGLWMKAEYVAMLPLPLFYGALVFYVWRKTRQTSFSIRRQAQPAQPDSGTDLGDLSEVGEPPEADRPSWVDQMVDTGPMPVYQGMAR